MNPEDFTYIVNVTREIATRRNKAMAVFKYNNTYYIVDAHEWGNGNPYGQYIITVEPGENLNQVLDLAETVPNQP